jgi:hypothetical protein
MAELIARLRLLTGDKAALPVFDDGELQDALDRYREEIRYERLEAFPTYAPGGAATYTLHKACRGNFETDVELVDLSYSPVETTEGGADYQNGRFTLTESTLTVMITGKRYDLYAAAIDVLEQWLAMLKDETDFSDGKRNFKDSQKRDAVEQLIKQYRRRARVKTGRILTPDINPDRRCGQSDRSRALVDDFMRRDG